MMMRYGLSRALRSMGINWRPALNTVLVLGASLSVLGVILLVYLNVLHFSRQWLSNTKVSIFLQLSVTEERRAELLEQMRTHPLVRKAELVSPEQGLRELADRLGANHALLAAGGESILPYTIDLEIFYDYRDRVDELAKEFRRIPGVQDVVYPERMLEQVDLFFQVVRALGLFFMAITLVSFYLVVSHATRLSMHVRREEIEILALVGATRRFIRAAFVMEGMLVSLAGGGLALILVWLCEQLLLGGLSFNAPTSGIVFDTVFFSWEQLGAGLLSALVLGGGSAHRAVNRVLREMEP